MVFIREEKAGNIKQPGAALKLIMTSGTMILPGGDLKSLAPSVPSPGINPLRTLGDQSSCGQLEIKERRLSLNRLNPVQNSFSQTFRPAMQGGIIGMVSTQTINKFSEPRTIRVRLCIDPAKSFDCRQGKVLIWEDLFG